MALKHCEDGPFKDNERALFTFSVFGVGCQRLTLNVTDKAPLQIILTYFLHTHTSL